MTLSRLRRFALVLSSTGMLASGIPAAAHADFEAPYNVKCSGSVVEAVTTRLQLPIVRPWARSYFGGSSPLSCNGLGNSEVETGPVSSPLVLEYLGSVGGVRESAIRGFSTEEPPTLSQWLNIDLGNKPGEDSGLIRQIPTASTAVVPIVHFPNGCPIPAKEATSDGRFIVSNLRLEQVYAGKIATWGELLPDIQPSCASIPIKRVVLEESEGTTFVFKQWLARVEPKQGWEESEAMPNTSWPNDSGATATVRTGGGDIGEIREVRATSGSIGFGSLPQSRSLGFGQFSPENPEHASGLFWLSLENGAGVRTEPTRDPRSGADNVLGANCDNPTFNYVPSGYDTTVTPVWRAVTAAGSRTGWPICTLMYALAWDDSSTVYGKTTTEEAQQRTVKDYLAYVLSSAGQNQAKEADYSALTAPFLADAQDGQSRVGWNKLPGSKSNSIKSQIAAAAKHNQP